MPGQGDLVDSVLTVRITELAGEMYDLRYCFTWSAWLDAVFLGKGHAYHPDEARSEPRNWQIPKTPRRPFGRRGRLKCTLRLGLWSPASLSWVHVRQTPSGFGEVSYRLFDGSACAWLPRHVGLSLHAGLQPRCRRV